MNNLFEAVAKELNLKLTQRNAAVIKNDTLTDEFVFGTTEGFAQEFNVNGEKVKLGVKVK